MSATATRLSFETFLEQHDAQAWASVVRDLLPHVHEVDRNATQIWFAFFPLDLVQALEESDDPGRLAKKLLLQGDFVLGNQIDTSHTFLYGHRYWPEVKKAVAEHAAGERFESDLGAQIRAVAATAAKRAGVDESLLVGIVAAAFMTVHQAGLEAFTATPGAVAIDRKSAARTPEQVLKGRSREVGQGLFGFLKSVNKDWVVTFDENADGGSFKVVNNQDLAMAGARDGRDFKAEDPRCVEGPIPVECRTAACGTCWVGVVAGADKLAPVEARERVKMKEFGYLDSNEDHPVLRLACVARAHGSVTIVVPRWNGVFGKYLIKEGKR